MLNMKNVGSCPKISPAKAHEWWSSKLVIQCHVRFKATKKLQSLRKRIKKQKGGELGKKFFKFRGRELGQAGRRSLDQVGKAARWEYKETVGGKPNGESVMETKSRTLASGEQKH